LGTKSRRILLVVVVGSYSFFNFSYKKTLIHAPSLVTIFVVNYFLAILHAVGVEPRIDLMASAGSAGGAM